jgi:hypothetical protein
MACRHIHYQIRLVSIVLCLAFSLLLPIQGDCRMENAAHGVSLVRWSQVLLRSVMEADKAESSPLYLSVADKPNSLRSSYLQATPLAYSANSSQLVSVVSSRTQATPEEEIWISQPSGDGAVKVTTEKTAAVGAVSWSPAADYLAYVTYTVTGRPQTPSEADQNTDLCLVRLPNGRKTTIAQDGAMAPQWSGDGGSLLFFKLRDGKWQPFRASNLSGQPKTSSVSDLQFDQPGAFSKDGEQIAGVVGNQIVTENLATHQRTESAFEETVNSIEWSPDAKWLLVEFITRDVRNPGPHWRQYLALDPFSGKCVSPNADLSAQIPLQQNQILRTLSASWIPNQGHRLLLQPVREIMTGDDDAVFDGPMVRSVDTLGWFTLDVNAATIQVLPGLPQSETFAFPTVWSPNAQFVSLYENEYRVQWH